MRSRAVPGLPLPAQNASDCDAHRWLHIRTDYRSLAQAYGLGRLPSAGGNETSRTKDVWPHQRRSVLIQAWGNFERLVAIPVGDEVSASIGVLTPMQFLNRGGRGQPQSGQGNHLSRGERLHSTPRYELAEAARNPWDSGGGFQYITFGSAPQPRFASP